MNPSSQATAKHTPSPYRSATRFLWRCLKAVMGLMLNVAAWMLLGHWLRGLHVVVGLLLSLRLGKDFLRLYRAGR